MGHKVRGPRIDCALDAAMSVVEGKWKVTILCKLYTKGSLRFNQLLKELEIVSPKILTKQLREMEEDGLIIRNIYSEVPVCVMYSISERGKSLAPTLGMLAQWGRENMIGYRVRFDEDVIMPDSLLADDLMIRDQGLSEKRGTNFRSYFS